jgi:hypothetical protein
VTAILSPDRIVGGTVIEIEHPAGLLRFEEFREGEWLTLKGQPAMTSRRGYYLDGEPLEFSVSEIVGLFEKPALYRWHEDRGVRGAVRAERLGELEGMPEEDWVRRVRMLGLGADAMRDESADRGQAIHTALQTLAAGGRVDVDAFPSEWMPWLTGALRAWLVLQPQVIASELLVCHPEMRYAGRLDLYALIDGKRTLLDYKTGKGRIWPEAHWQTRGYAEALPFSGFEPPESILILGIDDEGGFEFEECDVQPDEWAGLVSVAKARKRVQERRAARRKVARKAAA